MLDIARKLFWKKGYNAASLRDIADAYGCKPANIYNFFKKKEDIRDMGITVLLVEQEVNAVFKMADRNYVLSSGKIIAEGTGDELLQDEVLRKTYLGL